MLILKDLQDFERKQVYRKFDFDGKLLYGNDRNICWLPKGESWNTQYLYGAYFHFPQYNKLFIKVGYTSDPRKRFWKAKGIPKDPSLIISYFTVQYIGIMQNKIAYEWEQKLFRNIALEKIEKLPHWLHLLMDGGSELYEATTENAIKIAKEIHRISKPLRELDEKRLAKMHILPEPSKNFITKKSNYQLFSQGMKAKIEYFSSC